jgi:hypothetical protein
VKFDECVRFDVTTSPEVGPDVGSVVSTAWGELDSMCVVPTHPNPPTHLGIPELVNGRHGQGANAVKGSCHELLTVVHGGRSGTQLQHNVTCVGQSNNTCGSVHQLTKHAVDHNQPTE